MDNEKKRGLPKVPQFGMKQIKEEDLENDESIASETRATRQDLTRTFYSSSGGVEATESHALRQEMTYVDDASAEPQHQTCTIDTQTEKLPKTDLKVPKDHDWMEGHNWFPQLRRRSFRMLDWIEPPPKRPRRTDPLPDAFADLKRNEEPQELKSYEFKSVPIVRRGVLPVTLYRALIDFEEDFMFEPFEEDDCSANFSDVLELVREGILAIPSVKETWPRHKSSDFKGIPDGEDHYSWICDALLPIDSAITSQKILLNLRI
jgi:hypothetical protein